MRRFVFLIMLFVLAACGAPETATQPTSVPVATAPATNEACAEAALTAYRNTYNTIIDRWGSAVLRAGKADPSQIQPAITELQQIAGDMEGLAAPACAQPAHAETLEAMRLTVDGYQTLLKQADVGSKIADSIDLLSDARARVAALPGEPAPTPTAFPTNTPLPTFTPLPTPQPTATPVPTATPLPRAGIITSKAAQVFETSTSTQPVKTLLRDTRVEVFEAAKGRIHVRAGDVDGWVSQSSIIVQ